MQDGRRGSRTLILVAVLLILGLGLMAGCGQSQAGEVAMAREQGSDREIVVGLSAPELKGSFWVSIFYGVEDEARKQGVRLVSLEAGGYEHLQRQVEHVESLIQKQVDVIIIGAVDSQGVVPVVEEAVAAGIPVVGLSGIPATDRIAVAIGADHYGMGAIQAECIGEALGGRGQVAMASGPPGVIWAEERARGFRETLQARYSGIEIAAQQHTPTGRDQGLRLMEEWLQAFPSLSGVYTAVDDLGAGMVDALRAAGRLNQVQIASSNLSPIGRQYLQEGHLVCQSIQQIVLQGREAVRAAAALATGQPVAEKITTPVRKVTRDNLASLDLSEFQAPAGYKPGI